MATTITASTQAPIIKNYIRGDSRLFAPQILQSDGKTPFNLTGCEVFFTVNQNSDNTADNDTSAVIALKVTSFICPTTTTLPNGTTITAGTDTTAIGIAWIQVTNAVTQDIPPNTYFYDIQLKDASGNITSLAQNQFIVIADVTRSIS